MTALLPLYAIESELMELLALAEEPDLEPEAKEAIDQQIQAYVAAQIRKVDGIAATIRRCKSNAAIAREEAARITAMADAWEAREKRIKENALWAMQAHNVRLLETPTNKLRVQGHGGLEPLEIENENALPTSVFTATVRMPWPKWMELLNSLKEHNISFPFSASGELDNTALREALKRGPVAGARLLPRGSHLRVE